MTPDQTEIILGEYVEMNRAANGSGDEEQTVDLSEMSTQDGKLSMVPVPMSAENADLAKRVKAEMREKLARPAA